MSRIKEHYEAEIAANAVKRAASTLTPMDEMESFFTQLYSGVSDKVPAGYIRYTDGRLEKYDDMEVFSE